MKNTIFGIVGVGVLFLIGYFWLQSHLNGVAQIASQPERGTIVGTYVCLPLREESEVQTDCAAGVRTDEGDHYAIDLGLISQDAPQLVEGDRLSAAGIITPIATLSTDYWRRYDVTGIFSVTDSLQKLPQAEPELIGVYVGSLPCASCVSIDTRLELFSSRTATTGTYRLASVYVGESEEPVIDEGVWIRTQNATSTILQLLGSDTESAVVATYSVQSAHTLQLLAQDGSDIDSELSYELTLEGQNVQDPLFEYEWVWQHTLRTSGERIEPLQKDTFVLKFTGDLRYTSSTDCNSLSGNYVADQEVLSLGIPASTKMFCPDSQEQIYTQDLVLTNSYRIDGNELRLNLDRGYGVMVFLRK